MLIYNFLVTKSLRSCEDYLVVWTSVLCDYHTEVVERVVKIKITRIHP